MPLIKAVKDGLGKTRNGFWQKAVSLISGKGSLSSQEQSELEELLILSDVGVAASERLMKAIKQGSSGKSAGERLKEEILGILSMNSEFRIQNSESAVRPQVWLIIGVNGSGKTTSIAKLAHYLKGQGQQIMLAAGDTYRAAAIEQLKKWADRLEVEFIGSKTGADPASVAYDAVESAIAKNVSHLLIDTAGRLHTQKHLRDELGKIYSTIGKKMPGAPQLTLLVLDATTGQNAVSQVKLFSQAAKIDGIILTKLDGTAKGGIVLAIAQELGIPVFFTGIGEGLNDLLPFDPTAFVNSLLER
ncbi:MAG: signal recognition particle-docking protein FtsY [Candidatus Edwardsbacteria bacterium]|nr:signal recognition particle-docking protein FtsY [Candidatus Edwardsbacteria bacterium]MBU1577300.1 signal recognition particle-docking protein FtsY [Candidatus Edwardsbacteria bacterium]MBU2464273.1 signal recognition particle-docking protein FtsY [Candidatus Edwardsbacteria bacterium]MBU2594901.1 signal recognition particle-docking protein FtsY [Candidatus Edwardsbacteria bacterium]